MKAKKYKVMWLSIIAAIAVVCLALTVVFAIVFNIVKPYLIGTHPLGDGSTATRAEGESLVEQIQAEGTVLVKNGDKNGNDAILPLSSSVDKVNVFGWASTDWANSGSGSGQVKNNDTRSVEQEDGSTKSVTYPLDLFDALDQYGVEYNTELREYYEGFASRREVSEHGGAPGGGSSNAGTLKNFNFEYSRLYEPKIDGNPDYEEILANAEGYSDTAIVVIGRVSGESNDSPKVQYKITSPITQVATQGAPNTAEVDEERTYLEISTEEEELLEYVGANYDNVIVLINTTNVMELGFVETIPGLDACLVVATTGTSGALAIPKLLYGDLTPSGKLADTYAYDLTTNPTYVNTGSGMGNAKNNSGYGSEKTPMSTNLYTNSDNSLYPMNERHTNGSSDISYDGISYTDYQENIYVGYKWYETADAEGFWDSSVAKSQWNINKGYEDVVQYPFGYGLSYTDFEWTVTSQPDTLNITSSTIDDELKFEVTVENVGNMAGQDVVELYVEPPYHNGGIEKSAVNLVAFAKTPIALDAKGGDNTNASLTLSFKARDLASYDYGEKVVSGGGYVLEKGDYKLTFKTDAHNAKSGVGTYTLHVADDIEITTDESGNEISNKFTGAEAMDGVAIDGNSDGSVGGTEIVYMMRSDFEDTFPFEQAPNREMTEAVSKYNTAKAWVDEWETAHTDATAPTQGASGDLKVYDDGITDLGRELGMDFDNAKWKDVLDQVTVNEMSNLVLHGYVKTGEISSIGKIATKDLDGPNQVGSFDGGTKGTTGFSSIVLAQSWNTELAYSMGKQVGQDCLSKGVQGWYGPAINIHRSPFGGRNYEYYSEDALISGLMCANAVEGARYCGVFSYLKHLALYETESYRDGMYVWTTEQALREIYLKPFEISIKHADKWGINDMGSTAIMTSYGRAGAVWTGGSKALLSDKGVLRGEWGFHGAILTDYADFHEFMNGAQMVRAGGDLWMDGWTDNGTWTDGNISSSYTNSAAFQTELRRATKNVVYMWLNALVTNEKYNEGVEIYNTYITENPEGTTPPEGAINDTAVGSPAGFAYDFDWTILVLILFIVVWVAACAFGVVFVFLKSKKLAAKESGDASDAKNE